jgi:hypothetical protein
MRREEKRREKSASFELVWARMRREEKRQDKNEKERTRARIDK